MFGGPYDGVGGCLEGLMMGWWVFGGPYDGVVGVWRAL